MQKPELEKTLAESISKFMTLDNECLPEDHPLESGRITLYLVRELDRKCIVTHSDCKGKFKLKPGEYRVFEVIGDILYYGSPIRKIAVSPENEIFWVCGHHSTLEIGNPPKDSLPGKEIRFLFDYELETVTGWVRASAEVKTPLNYHPTKKEISDHVKKLHSFDAIKIE